MSKKKKNKDTNKKIISIQIPIETDEYLRKFILDNSFMRNKIRNDFAEEANKYKGKYNMYYDFDPWKFKTEYYNTIEKPENRYDYYCVGLSEQIALDFKTATKMIRTKNKKVLKKESDNKLGEYGYKQFDFNRYSFRVKLKPRYVDNRFYTRICIESCNHINFRIRSTGNQYSFKKEMLNITLKESLYDNVIHNDDGNDLYIKYYHNNRCTFMLSDIKDISFMYDCGKYYILLFINVEYHIDKKSRKYSKGRVAGIDTGIRHPLTIHDGYKTMYLRMDDKTSRRIHYLERRIKRLQHYKDIKYDYNKKHGLSTHSNNIIKLVKKIRRLYRKITNIKNHWARNIAKQITTTYEAIVVDTFEQPDKKTKEGLPKKVIHKINYVSRFHKMYYVNEFIKHDCDKYGCKYIESPEYSTCTCSICKHINLHLKLSDKYLKCEKCGNVIERDDNAAQNCYDYGIEKLNII